MKKKIKKGAVGLPVVIGVIAVVLLALGGYFIFTRMQGSQPASTATTGESSMVEKDNSTMMEENGSMMETIDYTNFQYMTILDDVSDGSSSGTAYANYNDDGYVVYATFDSLPELVEGFFYEGWVVRKSPNDVISTGVAEMVNGVYTNTFTSSSDLTDHDFYVLTLEPDDGDPAPAKHILEGTLVKN